MSARGRRLLRRAGLFLLVLLVAALHVVGMRVIGAHLGDAAQPMPPRIEVAYVRELAPTAPPVVAPAPAAPPVAAAFAMPAAPAASAAHPIRRPRNKASAKSKSETQAAGQALERASMPPRSSTESEADATAHAADAGVAPRGEAGAPPRTAEADTLPRRAGSDASPQPTEALLDAAAPLTSSAMQQASPTVSPAAAAPTGPRAVPTEPSGTATDAAVATPFAWPASTRVSYILTGNYRGEVKGDAQVEWVHAGSRYQVHLDLTVGASFAPLITRRMTSDGELTATGLAPRRYDQETKLMFHDRHRATLHFEPDAVVLADGQRRPRWPGVQDSASQFVQLTYLFTIHPELLAVGRSIELPLALPRKVDRWIYDVVDEEAVWTSFGPLAAFHVKPRREPQPGGDLIAETWFAPELRYLPVRIRISQDANTYIELLIARKPELAAP